MPRAKGLAVDSTKTRRALRTFREDVAGPSVNREAGREVLNATLRRVPRRSGRLAGSGRVAELTDGAAVIFGSDAVPYAQVINWGWPRRNIRPALFLPVDPYANVVRDVYADDVEKQVRKVDRTS